MPVRDRPDIAAAIAAERASAGADPAQSVFGQRDPGAGRAFVQGAGRGLGILGSLGDMATVGLAKLHGIGVEPEVRDELARGAQSVAQRLTPAPVPREDMGLLSRLAESAGAGLVSAAPFLPLGGGAGAIGTRALVRRALLEGTAAVTSEFAANEAERLGAGAIGQIGAGMAGGALPGLAVGAGRSVARMAVPAARRSAARDIAANTLAEQVGPQRERALQLLRDEVAERGSRRVGSATTAQVLDQVSPGAAQLEKDLATQPLTSAGAGTLGAEVQRIRQLNAKAIREAGEQLMPGGQIGAAREAFEEAEQQLSRRVRDAYNAVGDLDGIPTIGVKAKLAELRNEAGVALADDLIPSKTRKIVEKYGDAVDFKEMRALRRRLVQDIDRAGRTGSSETKRALVQLKQSIDDTLEAVANETGAPEIAALRRAMDANVDKMRLVGDVKAKPPQQLGSTAIFMAGEDMLGGFKKYILGSKRPSQEIGRLRILLGDNPEAWAGVQQLMRSTVFGEDMQRLATPRGVNQALAWFEKGKNREAWDFIYGFGASRNTTDFLKRARRLMSGTTGMPGQVRQTGSNTRAIRAQLAEQADQLIQSGAQGESMRGAFTKAAYRALRKATGQEATLREAEAYLAQALVDPQFAIPLLERATVSSAPVWERRIQRWAARPSRIVASVTAPDDMGGM